jgi:NADH-quinone oxidoreductase subunit L
MLVFAYLLYRPKSTFLGLTTPVALRQTLEDLFLSGFYLDRIYEWLIVRPYQRMASFLWLKVDEGGIDDRLDDTGTVFRYFSTGLQLWTTGRLSTYLKMLLLGLTIILGVLAINWISS